MPRLHETGRKSSSASTPTPSCTPRTGAKCSPASPCARRRRGHRQNLADANALASAVNAGARLSGGHRSGEKRGGSLGRNDDRLGCVGGVPARRRCSRSAVGMKRPPPKTSISHGDCRPPAGASSTSAAGSRGSRWCRRGARSGGNGAAGVADSGARCVNILAASCAIAPRICRSR